MFSHAIAKRMLRGNHPCSGLKVSAIIGHHRPSSASGARRDRACE
jgi:hypothetical protein